MKKMYVFSSKLIIGLLCLTVMLDTNAHPKQSPLAAMLTSHQWILIENIEKTDNISIDLNDFKSACEKDNIMVFNEDGTYQLLEGRFKCNSTDNDIKGIGEWSIDEQNKILIDKYSGGSKIEKSIITISDEMLKIQYTGEGKKVMLLTYLSEQGMKKEEYKQINIPESKLSQKVVELLNAYLEMTNHYRVVNKKDIEPNGNIPRDELDTARTGILLWPLSDKYDTTSLAVRKNELLSLAKKNQLRYVATGRIMELKTFNAKDGVKGKLRILLNILDVTNGKEYHSPFSGEGGNTPTEKSSKENKKGIGGMLDRAKKVFEKSTDILGMTGVLLQKQKLMEVYWKAFITRETLNRKGDEIQMFFSNIAPQERQNIYDSAMAINAALSDISDELEGFTAANLAYEIKINHIERDGKSIKLAIDAGENIRLFKGESLQLVQLIHSSKDGQMEISYSVIGDIVVESLSSNQDNMAYCIDKDKKSKVIKTYMEASNKEDYIVRTILQPPVNKE